MTEGRDFQQLPNKLKKESANHFIGYSSWPILENLVKVMFITKHRRRQKYVIWTMHNHIKAHIKGSVNVGEWKIKATLHNIFLFTIWYLKKKTSAYKSYTKNREPPKLWNMFNARRSHTNIRYVNRVNYTIRDNVHAYTICNTEHALEKYWRDEIQVYYTSNCKKKNGTTTYQTSYKGKHGKDFEGTYISYNAPTKWILYWSAI